MSTDIIEGELDSQEVASWCSLCEDVQMVADIFGDCESCGRGMWQSILVSARMNGDLSLITDLDINPQGEIIESVLNKSGHPGISLYLIQIMIERNRREVVGESNENTHLTGDDLVNFIYANLYEMGINGGYWWCTELQLHRPSRVRDLVYAMVEADLLSTSPSDSPKDFDRALLAVHWFEN